MATAAPGLHHNGPVDVPRRHLRLHPGDVDGVSPHAAGVAALTVSQYGRVGKDGDVKLSPQKVESLLRATAVDIGRSGYDTCFGHGRIDALRAVNGDTSSADDRTAPELP